MTKIIEGSLETILTGSFMEYRLRRREGNGKEKGKGSIIYNHSITWVYTVAYIHTF